MVPTVLPIDGREAGRRVAELVDLLHEAVREGASVGFLHPMAEGEAREYWEAVIAEVDAGERLLWIACEGSCGIGSCQLGLPLKPNALHRAEVQKLIVDRRHRRRGVGTDLIRAAEDTALARGRHLIVLDTRAGDASNRFYERLGYVRAGVIPGTPEARTAAWTAPPSTSATCAIRMGWCLAKRKVPAVP